MEIFKSGGNMCDFCLEVGASIQRVTRWQMDNEDFSEAVQLAKDIALSHWLKTGYKNLDNREFNVRLWEALGKRQFGNSEKISFRTTKGASPIEHYQEVMQQASLGNFTSSELKQLMESVNIGLRAEEVCTMQKQIDELKEGLVKMEERELEHQISNTETPETDKTAVDSEDGGQEDS
jgi:hypothetical protein